MGDKVSVSPIHRKKNLKQPGAPMRKKIGYISTASGTPQLWEINPDGSSPARISNVKDGIAGFRYAPDMKHVFYIANVKVESGCP